MIENTIIYLIQCGRILLCESCFFCLVTEREKHSFHVIPENLFCFQQTVQQHLSTMQHLSDRSATHYSNFAIHFGNTKWNHMPFTFEKKLSEYLELLLTFNEKVFKLKSSLPSLVPDFWCYLLLATLELRVCERQTRIGM